MLCHVKWDGMGRPSPEEYEAQRTRRAGAAAAGEEEQEKGVDDGSRGS